MVRRYTDGNSALADASLSTPVVSPGDGGGLTLINNLEIPDCEHKIDQQIVICQYIKCYFNEKRLHRTRGQASRIQRPSTQNPIF